MDVKPKRKNKKGAGVKTILNDELIARFVAAVESVLVLRHVCGMVTIHHSTVYDWLNKADRDRKLNKESIYVKFADALKKAQAGKVAEYLAILKEREKNWQAIAWILERCFREDFGADAGIINQLLEKQEKLEAMLQKYIESSR